MTSDDIKTIENELGVTLPPDFVRAGLTGRFKDPIHDDARSVIFINRSFRAGDYGDDNWDHQFIAFGHDGAGNYYCIDAQDIGRGVFLRDHETLQVSKSHESLEQLLEEWK